MDWKFSDSGNRINQWRMNWNQFIDPLCYLCLAGAVIASWSLIQEVAGSKPFYCNGEYFCPWIQWIQWKHLGKTQIINLFSLSYHSVSGCSRDDLYRFSGSSWRSFGATGSPLSGSTWSSPPSCSSGTCCSVASYACTTEKYTSTSRRKWKNLASNFQNIL